MNLVTGLWGMNVNVPGQEAAGLNWFFGVSLPAEPRTLGGKHPTDAPLCPQILGCLAAFAVVGAFLTYRVSRACLSFTSPCAMLMACSPCSSLSGDEDLALASLAEGIPHLYTLTTALLSTFVLLHICCPAIILSRSFASVA
jgi:hypothetical protein